MSKSNLTLVLAICLVPPLVGLCLGAWLFGPLLVDHWRQREVLRAGMPAQAQILSLADTGTLINYQKLVAISLEVMPEHAPPFQAVVRQTISVLNMQYFAPGNFVPVKYDPANHARVAFTMAPGHTGTLPAAQDSAP